MILLSRSYGGYAAATIVQLPTNVEAALIAQGLATASAGPVTAGAVTTNQTSGRLGIAAAGTSVVLTNSLITAESKIWAQLSNAAADATAVSLRVTPAAGLATIALNAASTGIVAVDWAILGPQGGITNNLS